MNSISSAEKLQLMQRLRCQGEWNEAAELREMIRLQARRAGHSRLKAREIAWTALEELFPPRSQVDIATEPIFQWLARCDRPHPSLTAIEPNKNLDELAAAVLWRISCVSLALHLAKSLRFRLLVFKAYEAMVHIADCDKDDIELRLIMANALEHPRRFLERCALPRLEAILSTEDALPEDAVKELRLLVDAIQQMAHHVVDDGVARAQG
jgi:hypothetical protein